MHGAAVVLAEGGVPGAGKALPDHRADQRAGLRAQDAVGFRIDVAETPLAIEGEHPFGHRIEDGHRTVPAPGRRILGLVEDVFHGAVVVEHRGVDHQPVALLEAAGGAIGDVEALLVMVRRPAADRPLERGLQGFDASARLFRLGKQFEQRAPHHVAGIRRHRLQRAAHRHHREAGRRAQHRDMAGHGLEDA